MQLGILAVVAALVAALTLMHIGIVSGAGGFQLDTSIKCGDTEFIPHPSDQEKVK